VTDIFFSYKSADRERVRPIHNALAAQGFEVFWDQQVPAGVDWDTWIRQHLTQSKCALVFWSAASVISDNVRHEASIAKHQGKLIPVLLEPLTVDQFPMGLYIQQAANLADWKGDFDQAEWGKLRREIESKLTPPWMLQQICQLEAELVAERARREAAESRDKVLQAQIAKEAKAQLDLKRERDQALDEVKALKATVAELSRASRNAMIPQLDEPVGKAPEAEKKRTEAARKLVGLPFAAAAPTKELVSKREPDAELVPDSLDHLGRNVYALFQTARGTLVRLRDARALAPVNGKYRLFGSVEEYRQFSKDYEEWREITDATEKRSFFAEARGLLEQVNGP
jgi:hypothetical protein